VIVEECPEVSEVHKGDYRNLDPEIDPQISGFEEFRISGFGIVGLKEFRISGFKFEDLLPINPQILNS
jgi:hypothetical protein